MRHELRVAELAGKRVWGQTDDYGSQKYLGDPWINFPSLEDLFRDDLGTFLSAYFCTSFKIFYGLLYRSVAQSRLAVGSQLWHSDGGPGTCVNVMFYPEDTNASNGPLEVLPWPDSLRVFEMEKRLGRLGILDIASRDVRSGFYADQIEKNYHGKTLRPSGPAGLVVPFLNNTIHRGGLPHPGHSRIAFVFHCYPSHRPVDFGRYRATGIGKSAPYPNDPAKEF